MSTSPMDAGRTIPSGSRKKIIYFVRHAEATHNVKEREAVQRAISLGETDKERQQEARKAVLREDETLKDAPLSADGTEQARSSGRKLQDLFQAGDAMSTAAGAETSIPVRSSFSDNYRRRSKSVTSPFRRPDVVLVSPLRRALMTATELFLHSEDGNGDPPLFLAIEALREKRTGFVCDERCSVAQLKSEFPHVDFSDVQTGIPAVPVGEDNDAVRQRVAEYLDTRLGSVPGKYLAIVSHKGWLRELRKTLRSRVEAGVLRANYDVTEWDTTLYGNAEVRVAAFKWQDGELLSVVSRSVDNAMLASASMMGDGFEFALGPPNTGFSIFLADRTTKVHFISLAEGRHNVAIREAAEWSTGYEDPVQAEAVLLRKPEQLASEHPLHDARLTGKGAKQADKLRQILAKRPSGGRPFTAFDLVIVSPLTRACETAQLIFGRTPGTYGGAEIPPPRILIKEECRERYGRYVCDSRRAVSKLAEEFPEFDFSEMQSDEDIWHGDERESALEVQERALHLLGWLSARPERCVAVVTHKEFLRHLFGQFGDTLHEEDRDCLQRTGANCELRSVVLCSHGNIEREESEVAPSTVRVASVSSLSSLVSYE